VKVSEISRGKTAGAIFADPEVAYYHREV